MSFTFSDKDKSVQEFLNRNSIKYGFNYIGPVNSKEWPHDLFHVSFIQTIGLNKEPFTTDYKTGIGHRLDRTKKGGIDAVTGRHLSAHRESLAIASNAPIYFPVRREDQFPSLFVPAPTAASVLYGLISDMDCGANTFEDFCANLGYDEDSRKAHDTYLACQKIGTQLKKVFKREHIEALRELLQDY
jgi:hypothetical protein